MLEDFEEKLSNEILFIIHYKPTNYGLQLREFLEFLKILMMSVLQFLFTEVGVDIFSTG